MPNRSALVLVVGPSGAGKDTLIAYAQERLNGNRRFVFARRIVTRASAPAIEDHDSLTPEAFAAKEAQGAFWLTWRAHGLAYALPGSLHMDVARGAVVVANVSRSVINEARRQATTLVIAHVTASPEVLRMRLTARGREPDDGIEGRLSRATPELSGHDVFEIHNDGAIERAGDVFVALLQKTAGGLNAG